MEALTEITVDGKATISAEPDTISLLIGINQRAGTYADAVEKLNEAGRSVSVALSNSGVADKAKTREFSINEDWEHKFDSDKRKLIGYEGVQQLVVDFPLNMGTLGKVLQEMGEVECRPSINTYFKVLDQAAMYQTARREALQAAATTASEIAEQLELTVTGIKTVTHAMARDESKFSLHVAFESNPSLQASLSVPDVVPEEVSSTVSISVVFQATHIPRAA